jgi:hypothetical protein
LGGARRAFIVSSARGLPSYFRECDNVDALPHSPFSATTIMPSFAFLWRAVSGAQAVDDENTSNQRRSATAYKRRGAPVRPRNDETRLREAVVDRRSGTGVADGELLDLI